MYTDIKKTLSMNNINKYYDKISIFKTFKPKLEYDENNIYRIQYEPHKYEPYDPDKIYNLNSKNYVCIKPQLDGDYMNSEYMHDDQIDDLDKIFIQGKHDFEYLELYGLHDYSKYKGPLKLTPHPFIQKYEHNPGLFKPTLIDVINLLNTKITLEDLEYIERIYITTIPYPSNIISQCYDLNTKKHQALTKVYMVKTNKKRKIVDTSDENDSNDDE